MPKLPKRTTSPKKVSRGSRRSSPRAGLIRRGRGGGFKIIKETGRRSSGSRWWPCPNCCGKRERRILSVSQKPTGSWSESDRGGTRLWEKVYKDWRQWKDYLGRIG